MLILILVLMLVFIIVHGCQKRPPRFPSPSPPLFHPIPFPLTPLQPSQSTKSNPHTKPHPGASRKRSLFTEKEHPKLCAYVDRLEAMDGWKRAVGKIVDVDGVFEDL